MQMHQLDMRARKMIQTLKDMTVRQSRPVEGITAGPRGSEALVPFENGGFWGRCEAEDWMDFRLTVTTPADYRGQVVLALTTGREGQWEAVNPQIVVWVNGRIEQAFDTRHTTLVLADEAVPGQRFDVFLQGYANGEWPNHGPRNQIPPRMLLRLNDVCDDVAQLVYDLDVIHEALLLEPDGCRSREKALYTLSDALNLLDLRNPHSEAFHASVAAARDYLRVNYYEPLADIQPEVHADVVGHTHIDVAWLWDLYQTRHKAVRSFATMLHLMERYPEFRFMSSQAQLYQFVKEDQPELFERIRQAVKDGRWEPEGGMWVEADCNVSGGEALVRQLLYGNEFFETEFGRRSKVLWLPDVFGYSAALPQILKKSGMDYFFTSKLSWSEFNCSPYDTFRWQGIDGSEVLTHFTPARDYSGGEYERHDDLSFFTTYNSMLAPSQVKGGWQRFQQKGVDNHFLVSYGYGDGGGGPTDWMLENARRMANPVQGLPAVKQTFPSEFFAELEKRVAGNKRLPKWAGELYLEYHRGTYTAMARNKRSNRLTEIALRELELWREYARRAVGLPYPNDELRSIWRRMLTLQFHDILPGSSIRKVYEDSAEIYAQLTGEIRRLQDEAFAALGAAVSGDLLLYNSLPRVREDIVWFDAPADVTALRDADGHVFPVQHADGRACAFVRGMQPMCATPVWFVRGQAAADGMQVSTGGFDTPFFRGTFDNAMRLTSLVDKRSGRELCKAGQALNRIVCYENRPHNYDAWDMNIYYNEHAWEVDGLVSAEVVDNGPVLSRIRCEYRFNNSRIVQHIVLYRDVPRIDFPTWVDWKEQHYLLKAHFPVDVFYQEATYDIQYGNVRRATHRNTTWDQARFEVCAHKWMDVSEGDYGFSLLNDCKYGHSADENSIALTLLKSSTYPNPDADQEEHNFTYAIMPHPGDWRSAAAPDMAYRLNMPVIARPGHSAEGSMVPFIQADCPNVMVESVKRALHGEETVIRLYEHHGQRAHVRLNLGFAAKQAWAASMMEDRQQPLDIADGVIELDLRPYEIFTLMVE